MNVSAKIGTLGKDGTQIRIKKNTTPIKWIARVNDEKEGRKSEVQKVRWIKKRKRKTKMRFGF